METANTNNPTETITPATAVCDSCSETIDQNSEYIVLAIETGEELCSLCRDDHYDNAYLTLLCYDRETILAEEREDVLFRLATDPAIPEDLLEELTNHPHVEVAGLAASTLAEWFYEDGHWAE